MALRDKKKLRIVHCVRSPMGGIFKHIDDLSRTQSNAGHDVGLIYDTLTEGDFERAHAEQMASNLRLGVVRMPMQRSLSLSDIPTTFRVYKALREMKPDVIHCHGSKGGAYGRVASLFLKHEGKRPITLYCPHGGSLSFESDTIKGRIFFALERALAKITHGFVFVCNFERETFHRKVTKDGITSRIVHNAIRDDEFVPIEPFEAATDFVFIGTLRHVKGVDIILEALKILTQRGRTPTLTVCGAGAEELPLKEMVSQFGLDKQVTFVGAMSAREALPHGRCTVLPSRFESFPYVVLETQGAKRPLLTTDVGGISEAFPGEPEILLRPDDPLQLADEMERFLDDPVHFEDAAALRHIKAKELFTAHTMASKITEFYFNLKGEQ